MLKDQQAAGDADGKTKYVQQGVSLSFEQIAYGELQVIFKHGMLVLLVITALAGPGGFAGLDHSARKLCCFADRAY